MRASVSTPIPTRTSALQRHTEDNGTTGRRDDGTTPSTQTNTHDRIIASSHHHARFANPVRIPDFTVLPQPRVHLGERRYALQLFPLLRMPSDPVLNVLMLRRMRRMIRGRRPRRAHVPHTLRVLATPTPSDMLLSPAGAENPSFLFVCLSAREQAGGRRPFDGQRVPRPRPRPRPRDAPGYRLDTAWIPVVGRSSPAQSHRLHADAHERTPTRGVHRTRQRATERSGSDRQSDRQRDRQRDRETNKSEKSIIIMKPPVICPYSVPGRYTCIEARPSASPTSHPRYWTVVSCTSYSFFPLSYIYRNLRRVGE